MAELSPLTAKIIAEATSALAAFTPENIREAHEEHRKQLALTAEEQAKRDAAAAIVDKAVAQKKALEAYHGIIQGREAALIAAQQQHAEAVKHLAADKATVQAAVDELNTHAAELDAHEKSLELRTADIKAQSLQVEARKNALDIREGKVAIRESKILTAAKTLDETA